MALDLPPAIWLPPKAAIVRPAEPALLSGSFLPANPADRREALRELVRSKRISREQAREAFVFYAPPIFTAKRPAAIVALADHTAISTDLQTYTFTSRPLGAVPTGTQRRYIVALATTNNSPTLSSLVIAGVTSTALLASTGSGPSYARYAEISTGTAGNVVVTWSGSTGRCGLILYAVYTDRALAITDAQAASGGSGAQSVNVAVAAGGVVVGFASNQTTLRTFTWAGLSEDVDEATESPGSQSSASASFATAQAAYAVTETPSGTASENRLLVASLR